MMNTGPYDEKLDAYNNQFNQFNNAAMMDKAGYSGNSNRGGQQSPNGYGGQNGRQGGRNSPNGRGANGAGGAAGGGGRTTVRVIHPYNPTLGDELPLVPGQEIYIVKNFDDGCVPSSPKHYV